MARPSTITKDQIIQAAEALQEEGIGPTVQAVRERIGSGSYTTINTTLAEWRRENTARVVADIPAMPDKVLAAFNQAWSTAVRQTQEDMEGERQAFEAKRREMDKEQAGMSEEIERLEKALIDATEKTGRIEEELNQERQARAKESEELKTLVKETLIENARLDERAKAAETRAEEFKDQLKALQEKMAELAHSSAP